MDRQALQDHIESVLKDAHIDSAALEAKIIIQERAPNAAVISDQAQKQTQEDLQKRVNGMPLSRIYGKNEFWGHDFGLNAHTLDPRLDSETLIDIALKRFRTHNPKRILDLGTGSGCLLLTLLKEWPESKGVGVDVSFDAASQAQENAESLNISGRAAFICGDWAESIHAEFDLVIANPPYIDSQTLQNLASNVLNYDPILALDGGQDGLASYKILFSQLKNILKPSGLALFEIGFDQGESVPRIVEDSGFTVKCVHPDLSGQPRVVEISCGDK